MSDEEFFIAHMRELQRQVLWYTAWGTIGIAYVLDCHLGIHR